MNKILHTLIAHKVLVLLVLLVPAVIFAGNYFLNKSESTTANQTQTTTATVKRGDITNSVSASGQIQTSNYLAVTTSVNGIVKQVFVKEGDVVKEGQKIMEITLDSEGQISQQTAYAAYLRAKNTVDSANADLYPLQSTMIQKKEAFDTVKKTNSYQTHDERIQYKLAENDYLKAKDDYDQQKSVIDQANISLASAWNSYQAQSPVITAPSDGTIANIVAVQGTKIENSVSDRSVQTVASLKKEGSPIASVNVTELDINKIQVGQKVNLTLNSIDGTTFTGAVAGIDKIGTVSNGVSNYPVIIKFDGNSEKVLPNMGVDADIVVDEKKNVLYVPTAAIQTRGNNKTVQVVENGGTRTVQVQTGISDSTNTEITEGLNEGDVVVINALPTSGFQTTGQNNRPGAGFGIFR